MIALIRAKREPDPIKVYLAGEVCGMIVHMALKEELNFLSQKVNNASNRRANSLQHQIEEKLTEETTNFSEFQRCSRVDRPDKSKRC